ncbi:MAG: YqiA/YcfP family alpha/beta fold hydrolase [Pseudomonadota bacterium]
MKSRSLVGATDGRPLKIIYLHGFNSSGNATKSQILRAAVEEYAPQIEYYSPTLIHNPEKAMSELQAILDVQSQQFQFCFVGSSLGGFFAIYLANRYADAKAVLINPAINPWETMHHYYGHYENEATGEKFEVTENFVSSLQNFGVDKIKHPERFLLLLQTDDNVIDYRVALNAFPNSPHLIRTGGGHTFTDFQEVIPEILRFI